MQAQTHERQVRPLKGLELNDRCNRDLIVHKLYSLMMRVDGKVLNNMSKLFNNITFFLM